MEQKRGRTVINLVDEWLWPTGVGGLVPKHNPGAKTEEGKLRQKMASWKHGLRSKEAIAEKRAFREMVRECKSLLGWALKSHKCVP